jgi:hypothetical protein
VDATQGYGAGEFLLRRLPRASYSDLRPRFCGNLKPRGSLFFSTFDPAGSLPAGTAAACARLLACSAHCHSATGLAPWI